MLAKDLKLLPAFPFYSGSKDLKFHFEAMRDIFLSYLSDPLPFSDQTSLETWIKESIPWIQSSSIDSPPDVLTLFFLVKPFSILSTDSFILDMVKRWLIPNQEVMILSFKRMEFYFEIHKKQPFFIGEMQVLIRDKKEEDLVISTLDFLKKEIAHAFSDSQYARILLDTKILPLDDKINLIRGVLIKLIHRFPDQLNEGLFEQLILVQTQTSKKFREERSYLHIGRVILTLSLIRNYFDRKLTFFPEKRHIKIFMKPTELLFPFGKKPVLGFCIAVNLFHQYEFFNEKHVLRAVQKEFSNVRLVNGSVYQWQSSNSIATLYLEIEKTQGGSFTLEEKKTLKKTLERELKKTIEHLLPSVFMVRNEEETMRNILMLSKEFKSSDDLPQMMITFDRHSQEDLVFTVVLLRVRKEGMVSLQDRMKNTDPQIRFVLDRVQIVSSLDNHHLIEANVFRLQIKELLSFLRTDFSVNLYLAREKVVSFLREHLGEIRDYNGGLMVKQSELLTQFKRLFQETFLKDPELLENFFYSLNPIESQATLDLPCLTLFFNAFIQMTKKEFLNRETYLMEIDRRQEGVIVTIRANNWAFRLSVEEALSEIQIRERCLISSTVVFEGDHYLSYLYQDSDPDKGYQFEQTLQAALKKWKANQSQLQILKIPCPDAFFLDPRIGGEQDSSVLIKLLFDGLMRIDEKGIPQCAVAERYHISEDKKIYTFYLRHSLWSNGDPVTAYDFEYTWKKILSPQFITPFTYLFDLIKNARKAKEGLVSTDQIGVCALDERTLVVELTTPAPYFLEVTANTLYFPVNRSVDQMHPNWSTQKDESFVCNGPFKQVHPNGNHLYELQKNPYYWNKERIQIDHIHLSQLSPEDAFQMFQKGQLDCIESNKSFRGSLGLDFTALKGEICRYYSPRVFWICFNITQFPFNHLKMRRAFSMAVRRSELLEWDVGTELPAYTPLAYHLSQCKNSPYLIDEDEQKAKQLFLETLDEIHMKIEDFPIIYLSVIKTDQEIFEILKKQWERVLGIQCVLEITDWNSHFKRMEAKNYHLGGAYWISWVNDPMYTLQCFKYAKEQVNFAGWENAKFQHYLDQSNQFADRSLRNVFFRKAEELLIKEAVVLPIFYGTGWCIKNSNLAFNLISSNGSIDFSNAYFKTYSNRDPFTSTH